MKISFKHKGEFSKAINQMNIYKHLTGENRLDKAGEMAVEALRACTPINTGELADGWSYEVERKDGVTTASIYNDSHSEVGDGRNLALMLEHGHGTGTGGYIPPTHFISNCMDDIDEALREEIGGVLKDVK